MLGPFSPLLLALAALAPLTSVQAAGGSASANYYSFTATSGSNIRGRWGHAAAYVPDSQAVYLTGGQVVSSASAGSSSTSTSSGNGGVSITNEILRLDLSTSGAQPATDSSSASFPASAFHSLAYDTAKSELVSFGGLTSNCSLAPMMAMSVASGTSSWSSVSVSGLVRRRGHAQAYVPATSSTDDSMVIVGGVADRYVCASSTYAYPAWDVVTLGGSASGSIKTQALRSSLVGGASAPVADFSLTRINSSSSYALLLAGGSDASGALVGFDVVAKYDAATESWSSMRTSGDVPEARAGHSMVQHPTQSNLLVLHGGSTSSSSSSTSSSNLLAFLNTTSWTWSTPSNLQPPSADGRAWHSAVMTDVGVMVVAFGLGSGGSARSDVTFLDMRDSDSSKWGWKSVWSTSMLESADSSQSTIPTSNATAQGSSSNETKKRASIAVPVVLVFCLVLLPAMIWFGRRQIREIRHRRMARNYEIDNDNGDSSRMTRLTAALGKLVPASKRQSLTPRPYGGIRLADETEGAPKFLTNPIGWVRNATRRSRPATTSSEKPSQWEEIDFGLGKVDESRRPSTHANRTPAMREVAMTDAEKAARKASLRVTFAKDHQLVAPFRSVSTPITTPQSVLEYPTLQPVETRSPQPVGSPTFASPQEMQSNAAAWNSLADAVSSNPPFKDAPASVTVLPPLEFQRRPSAPLFGPAANRRLSEGQLLNPFAERDALVARRPSTIESSKSTPISSSLVDALGISTPGEASTPSTRRSSNPPPTPPPGGPLPRPPSSASHHTKRSSKDSQLRVVNKTPSPSSAQSEWK